MYPFFLMHRFRFSHSRILQLCSCTWNYQMRERILFFVLDERIFALHTSHCPVKLLLSCLILFWLTYKDQFFRIWRCCLKNSTKSCFFELRAEFDIQHCSLGFYGLVFKWDHAGKYDCWGLGKTLIPCFGFCWIRLDLLIFIIFMMTKKSLS